jgi:hypothetical protein
MWELPTMEKANLDRDREAFQKIFKKRQICQRKQKKDLNRNRQVLAIIQGFRARFSMNFSYIIYYSDNCSIILPLRINLKFRKAVSSELRD